MNKIWVLEFDEKFHAEFSFKSDFYLCRRLTTVCLDFYYFLSLCSNSRHTVKYSYALEIAFDIVNYCYSVVSRLELRECFITWKSVEILIEHIDSKSSLESWLFFISIWFIKKVNRNWVTGTFCNSTFFWKERASRERLGESLESLRKTFREKRSEFEADIANLKTRDFVHTSEATRVIT